MHAQTFKMADATIVTDESEDCVILGDGTRCDESHSGDLIPLEGASSKIWK